jgi:hypothetical protein
MLNVVVEKYVLLLWECKNENLQFIRHILVHNDRMLILTTSKVQPLLAHGKRI